MNICGVSFGAAFGGEARTAPFNKVSSVAMNLSKDLGGSLVLIVDAFRCVVKEGAPMDAHFDGAGFDFGVCE